MESIRDVEKRATLGQRGFTLIEIIAVLVIMGVLAAVAVPKYYDMTSQAREQAAKAALAQGNSNMATCFAAQTLGSNTTCDKNEPFPGSPTGGWAATTTALSSTDAGVTCVISKTNSTPDTPGYLTWVGPCSELP